MLLQKKTQYHCSDIHGQHNPSPCGGLLTHKSLLFQYFTHNSDQHFPTQTVQPHSNAITKLVTFPLSLLRILVFEEDGASQQIDPLSLLRILGIWDESGCEVLQSLHVIMALGGQDLLQPT